MCLAKRTMHHSSGGAAIDCNDMDQQHCCVVCEVVQNIFAATVAASAALLRYLPAATL